MKALPFYKREIDHLQFYILFQQETICLSGIFALNQYINVLVATIVPEKRNTLRLFGTVLCSHFPLFNILSRNFWLLLSGARFYGKVHIDGSGAFIRIANDVNNNIIMKRTLKNNQSQEEAEGKIKKKKKKMNDPKISLTRRWLPNLLPILPAASIPITILTYNILAQSNISHTMQLYPDPKHLDWARRLPMIKAYTRWYEDE